MSSVGDLGNQNRAPGEALRRRKQRSENLTVIVAQSVTQSAGRFEFDVEGEEAIEERRLAIEVVLPEAAAGDGRACGQSLVASLDVPF